MRVPCTRESLPVRDIMGVLISGTYRQYVDMGDDMLEGDTAETVSELFDTQGSRPNRANPLESLTESERRRAFDGFEPRTAAAGPGKTHNTRYERRTAIWALATVALALFASVLLGFASIDAGEPATAFGAGLLTGGSGLALGFVFVRESAL